MATATGHAVYQIECCIRGYHVYHRIWHPIIGEVLETTRERENEHDCYAVAVLEEETHCVVGHLPRLIRHECYFFLRTGGILTGDLAVVRTRHCYDFWTRLNCASQILITHVSSCHKAILIMCQHSKIIIFGDA